MDELCLNYYYVIMIIIISFSFVIWMPSNLIIQQTKPEHSFA